MVHNERPDVSNPIEVDQITHTLADGAPHDNELSLLDIVSLVLRRRRLILMVTFAGALFALVGALGTQLEYTATASFLPHSGERPGLSGVSSLAQSFGFAIPRSGDAERSSEFYQELLLSRKILDELVRSDVPVVTPAGTRTIDLSRHFEIEGETAEERSVLTRVVLAEVVAVGVAPVTGVVTVRVRTDDPGLSAAICRRLLELIVTFDVDTRQSQASSERNFTEERLGALQGELAIDEDSLKAFLVENRQFSNSPQLTFDHDHLQRQVVMRQELVTAMAQAHEQARIDEVSATSVITVIDQPEPPVFPEPRGRLLRVLLGVIVGVIVGFGLALIQEFGERAKNERGEAYGKFQHVLKATKRDPFGLRPVDRPAPSSVESGE